MGQTQSKTQSSAFQKKLAAIAMNSAMECAAAITVNQDLDIGGSGNFLWGSKQLANASVNQSCLQKSSFTTDLQTKLMSAIAAEAKATGQQISLADTSSSAYTATNEEIENRINAAFTAKLASTLNANQTMKLSGSGNIVINPEQTASETAVASLIDDALTGVQAYDSIVASQNASSSATTENMLAGIIESIGNAVSSIFSWIKYLVVGIVIIILVGITAKIYTSSQSSATNPTATTSTNSTATATVVATATAATPTKNNTEETPSISQLVSTKSNAPTV